MQSRMFLYGALLGSSFVYLLVALVVAPPPPAGGPDTTLLFALGPAALTCLVLSFVLPRMTLRTSLLALGLGVRASEPFSELPAGTNVFVDAAAAREAARRPLQTAMVLTVALRESIAMFGLVLAFLGFGLTTYLPFFVVSWISMALAFPRQAADDAALEAAYGAKLV